MDRKVEKFLEKLYKKGYGPIETEQIEALYRTLVVLTEDEITLTYLDRTQPQIVRTVAEHLIKKDKFQALERVLDRATGKPAQTIKGASTGNISLNITKYDPEPQAPPQV